MAEIPRFTEQALVVEEPAGENLIFRISAERIDTTNAVDFRAVVENSLDNEFRNYILDFSKVGLIDSSGFSVLIMLAKKMPPEKNIFLTSLNKDILKVFTMMRLDSLFRIFSSTEEVLADNSY
ncbi:STAS domain-containing protein [Maridesulfovibrio bastinii]|uniref:STAS domain-containing protein n=1 Tax=Maridesulfovibrio bastinii TaxID=47157 RepID=UPI00041CA6F6|nr:STAS domain-containing protein [Maridesulfovibrio bastinii]